ncbi:hypothetical protein [Vibrio phage JSF12]|uniref:Uncharacterized protein n=2 Tax=Jesfedecavirus TaxID=2560156 RepID=A0A2D0Z3N7_9CAUD|nr:hypothetical protein FDI98_gp141 [Vibrio phage JSF10]YP_009794722.1 hypothetical protein HOS35_gp039 [Vibrio phage JSF12]ASV43391.1 hypothetical protein [Vibrio phage JSF10]ASV43557.1 hypothetical protein [Vibrio phage JSF12]
MEIKKAIKQHKRISRAAKRFGTYYDYCRIEKNDILDMFFVPVMVNRPNRRPICSGYVSLTDAEVAKLKGV